MVLVRASPALYLDLVRASAPTEHLGVHGLVRVWAQNGLIWASVVGVWIIRPILEMGTFVVAG